MKEKGGWIAGEARRQDIVMEDAVIEELVEASQQISRGDLNPFKEHIGEIHPVNLERSFSGFLVRKEAITFKVNTEMLMARIEVLKDQLLIGKFVGSKPLPQAMRVLFMKIGLYGLNLKESKAETSELSVFIPPTDRRDLWHIMIDALPKDCERIIGGDFNMTKWPHDKSNDYG